MIDLSALGTCVEAEAFTATTERIATYARVIGDNEAAHLRGELAPPVFSALIVHESVKEALRRLIGPDDAGMCLHGEHVVVTRQPLRGDATVSGRAVALAASPTRAGTAIVVKGETLSAGGEVLNEHYFTSILPGKLVVDEPVGHAEVPKPLLAQRSGDGIVQGDTWVPDDITFHYAEVSGDDHRFHVDVVAARAAGFKTVIVHGLCTLALVVRVLAQELCPGHPERLAIVGARFAAPLLPGRIITTVAWRAMPGQATWAFETFDQDRTLVLKNGFVELGEPGDR